MPKKQYNNYYGQSAAAKDINSWINYLDRYESKNEWAKKWMHDDSNIHFGNYVRDNESVWKKWLESGKKDNKDLWAFGQADWKAGGNQKDRYVAKILKGKNPGDLNKTGSKYDDMGVVSVFKSARWGYDQKAQDKLRASWGKDYWGRKGYNKGHNVHWYDPKDKTNRYGVTKGVLGGGQAPKDLMHVNPNYLPVKEDKPKTAGGNSGRPRPANNGSFFNDLSKGYQGRGGSYKPRWFDHVGKPTRGPKSINGGPRHPKGPKGGGRYKPRWFDHVGKPPSRSNWVNNETGEVWKSTPGKRGDYEPGYRPAPGDGREVWKDDPRLQQWTKTPTGKPSRQDRATGRYNNRHHLRDLNLTNPKGRIGPDSILRLINGGPRHPKGPKGGGIKDINGGPRGDGQMWAGGDPHFDERTGKGDTYKGRGWANYWQQSIPKRDDSKWSDDFFNQAVRMGAESQVINREKLTERIDARSRGHMDEADYLGYLSRGQMLGENRHKWEKPGGIGSTYEPNTDIKPWLDRIYNIGGK